MTTPFWYNDPTILINKENITELWPTNKMTFEEKLNAITRLVMLMSFLGFLFMRNVNLLIIGLVTLGIIFSIYKLRKQNIIQEGLTTNRNIKKNKHIITNSATTTNPVTLDSVLKSEFYPTTKKNPFGNVLLTEIGDNPNRKSAAPSFNPDVYEDIDKAVKKQTQMLNPGIINTNKQLYGDLKDNYDLDNSMMQFYSMPNTRIENDQGAYSKYLYGGMYSSKEDTPEGALMRVKNNWQWINP
jgi:hypothetical protein